MLSKKHRFHGYGSLNYAYKRGKTIRSPFCSMRFVPGKYDDYRVSVVVSKKVAKSAPHRNRIRRRVYEAVRLNDQALKNQDIVITIFDDKFLELPTEELHSTIKRQLTAISRMS